MTLVKYEYIRTKLDKDKPYLKNNRIIVIPNFTKKYKYYLFTKRYDTTIKDYEYFILMSDIKFDINCDKCFYDNNDLNIYLNNEEYSLMLAIAHNNCNFDISYVETDGDYDIWQIS